MAIFKVYIGKTLTLVESELDINRVREYYTTCVSGGAYIEPVEIINVDQYVEPILAKEPVAKEPVVKEPVVTKKWQGDIVKMSTELATMLEEKTRIEYKISTLMREEAMAGAKARFGDVVDYVGSLQQSGRSINGMVGFDGKFTEVWE